MGFTGRRTAIDHPGRARLGPAFALCLLAVLAIGSSAGGQEPAALGPEADALQPMASVTLDGEELFRVRGTTAYPAESRAKAITQRLHTFAADLSLSVDSLRVVDDEELLRIVAGDETLLRVFPADAEIEGIASNALASAIRSRIATAVLSYRADRRPTVLLRRLAYAVAATLLLVLGFIAIARSLRRIESRIERRYKATLDKLRIQSFHFIHPDQLWAVLLVLLRLLRVAALVVLALGYANFVLRQFPWTRSLAIRGDALLFGPLRAMGQAILAAVPGLIFIAFLFLITRYFLRMTRLFFEGIEKQTLRFAGFDSDWAMPTYRIVRVLIIVFAIVLAYPYIPGSNTAAFKGISVFLGLLFSLGSSSLIANIIAGHTMTYRRAFKLGDVVRIGDVFGVVTDLGVMVTRVRSIKNESIAVPNSNILQSSVINYTTLAKTRGLILHTTVGIGYETPWRQVEAMLLAAAARTAGVRHEPAPFVLQKALGDFCVAYEINVYTDQPERITQTYTTLHQHILDVFNEYGVQIMTPAYMGDPEQPKVVPRDKWYEQPAQPPTS